MAAAASTFEFMDWVASQLVRRDEGLELGASDEERALRSLVDAMHLMHREQLQEKYLVDEDDLATDPSDERRADGVTGHASQNLDRDFLESDENDTAASDADTDPLAGWRT